MKFGIIDNMRVTRRATLTRRDGWTDGVVYTDHGTVEVYVETGAIQLRLWYANRLWMWWSRGYVTKSTPHLSRIATEFARNVVEQHADNL